MNSTAEPIPTLSYPPLVRRSLLVALFRRTAEPVSKRHNQFSSVTLKYLVWGTVADTPHTGLRIVWTWSLLSFRTFHSLDSLRDKSNTSCVPLFGARAFVLRQSNAGLPPVNAIPTPGNPCSIKSVSWLDFTAGYCSGGGVSQPNMFR